MACRITAFALIGWMLGQSLIPPSAFDIERARGAEVANHLAAWTRAPSNVVLHPTLASVPSDWVVDWLSALRRSGHAVFWDGSPVPVAATTEAVVDPVSTVRIELAAPARTTATLSDDAGPIDTVTVSSYGATITTPGITGHLVADVGAQQLSLAVPDSARTRAIAVVGAASWEAKFIAAALEERGWPVIARFAVAPGIDVSQGTLLPLDTSRIAAVIAVDTTIQSLRAALDKYVRSGGGLVIAGPASLATSLASLRAGASSGRIAPAKQPGDMIGLGATGYYPVGSLAPGSIPLEHRAPNAGIAIAARRIAAGRVLQIGYDDSWRWRMTGGPAGEAAHRAWWSRVVASVAYEPVASENAATGTAPVARLVDRVGPARPMPLLSLANREVDQRLLMALALLLLLVEWTSRRMRGLR